MKRPAHQLTRFHRPPPANRGGDQWGRLYSAKRKTRANPRRRSAPGVSTAETTRGGRPAVPAGPPSPAAAIREVCKTRGQDVEAVARRIQRKMDAEIFATGEMGVPMLVDLLEVVTARDDLVPDPFMGAGATLDAARKIGRRAIGIEQDLGFCDAAARRLEQRLLFAP
jgi:hypothetical protein